MNFHPVMTPTDISAFWDEVFPQIQSGRDYTIEKILPGEAVLRLNADKRHLRPGGTISGPALFTLADVGAYAVLLAHLGPEPLIVTTSFNINFMRRAPIGAILGHSRILKLGTRLAVVEVEIKSPGSEELVAHATATYSIPNRAGTSLPAT